MDFDCAELVENGVVDVDPMDAAMLPKPNEDEAVVVPPADDWSPCIGFGALYF